MKEEITDYIARCLECWKVDFEHRHPRGMLQYLRTKKWKWDVVSMDLIMKLSNTRLQHDAMMVVVEEITKANHFIPVKTTHKTTQMVNLYMKGLVRLNCIPKSIVSDMDSKFTCHFWKGLFKGFGTNLNMSISHHPQIDG